MLQCHHDNMLDPFSLSLSPSNQTAPNNDAIAATEPPNIHENTGSQARFVFTFNMRATKPLNIANNPNPQTSNASAIVADPSFPPRFKANILDGR
mmetsp:Transcript_32907/g.69243  ORF Transcript_32907/g.69243 Transcript_32907/m.69243 type:complete len:95 (-) Transcript_32907:1571-1855(-)